MSPRARVGITIGTDLVTAVELRQSWRGARPGRVWSWTLPSPIDDAGGQALVSALEELAETFGAAEVSASVALLRPLAQAKVIATPPIPRRALDQLVQRNAQRYFITGPDATLATASPVGTAPGRPSTRAVAVCAAEQTVADVVAAAAGAGIALERITAAPLALREAIRALAPCTRHGSLLALAAGPNWAEALLVDEDALRLAVPLPLASVADAESTERTVSRLIADGDGCGSRPTRFLLLSADAARDEAAHGRLAGTDAGLAVVPMPPAVAELSTDALAAFGVAFAGARTPSLSTDALRDDRRRIAFRRTASIYAVAAMMVGVGALAHLWTLERRLDRVEASRRALAPSLAPVMAERRTIDAARSTLESLARIEAGSPRWTQPLATLSRALPSSAYLLSLSTNGSKLQLTGLAASAHAVVAPLEASRGFSDVALAGASRRDGADRRERFELSVNIDRPGAVGRATPLVQPAGRADR